MHLFLQGKPLCSFQLGALFISCDSLSQSFSWYQSKNDSAIGFDPAAYHLFVFLLSSFPWFHHLVPTRFSLIYWFIAPVTWFRLVHCTALSVISLLWYTLVRCRYFPVLLFRWLYWLLLSDHDLVLFDRRLAIEKLECMFSKFDGTNYVLWKSHFQFFVERKGIRDISMDPKRDLRNQTYKNLSNGRSIMPE